MTRKEEHLDQSILWDYLDKNLSQQESEKVRNHLDICHECSLEYKSMIMIHEDLSGMEVEETPVRFTENIVDAIVESRKKDKAFRFWSKLTEKTIIIGLLLSLIFAFLIIGRNSVNIGELYNTTHFNKASMYLLLFSFLAWMIYSFELMLNKYLGSK